MTKASSGPITSRSPRTPLACSMITRDSRAVVNWATAEVNRCFSSRRPEIDSINARYSGGRSVRSVNEQPGVSKPVRLASSMSSRSSETRSSNSTDLTVRSGGAGRRTRSP